MHIHACTWAKGSELLATCPPQGCRREPPVRGRREGAGRSQAGGGGRSCCAPGSELLLALAGPRPGTVPPRDVGGQRCLASLVFASLTATGMARPCIYLNKYSRSGGCNNDYQVLPSE